MNKQENNYLIVEYSGDDVFVLMIDKNLWINGKQYDPLIHKNVKVTYKNNFKRNMIIFINSLFIINYFIYINLENQTYIKISLIVSIILFLSRIGLFFKKEKHFINN